MFILIADRFPLRKFFGSQGCTPLFVRWRHCSDSERFAPLAFGLSGKVVQRAHSQNALVTLPPLEEFEANAVLGSVIPLAPPRPKKAN